jgi:hypothetical protein
MVDHTLFRLHLLHEKVYARFFLAEPVPDILFSMSHPVYRMARWIYGRDEKYDHRAAQNDFLAFLSSLEETCKN